MNFTEIYSYLLVPSQFHIKSSNNSLNDRYGQAQRSRMSYENGYSLRNLLSKKVLLKVNGKISCRHRCSDVKLAKCL